MTTTSPGAGDQGNLDLSTELTGDSAVVTLRGEVDVYTAPAVREELYRLVDGGTRRIALNLRGMDFIDSSGLGVFVGVLKRVREASGDLELRALQPAARKVFEITGLTQVFSVTD
jgi:anti-sigma B factor antagonist